MEREGVPQDNTYAHMWFNKSQNESEKAAMNRGIVAKKMTLARSISVGLVGK